VFFASCSAAFSQPLPTTRELAELSLEELANIQVTSVSRRAERLADAAASIYIITADDIRQSGAMTLPEALRLAPNVQVAQVSASSFTIQARGVYNTSANKMLVLIDGRSVYSPLFAGVFWDVQDVMLEDVERIEVVSGPAGTLWGLNAVNGVINVVTRSARDTTGGLAAGHAGERDSSGAMRYGFEAGAGALRVHGKYFDRDPTFNAAGTANADAWHRGQVGLRGDWEWGPDRLSMNANAYRGTIGQPLPGSISISGLALALAPIPVSGSNATARWTHRLANGSETTLQAYVDRTERTVPPTFAEQLDIGDVQFQHALSFDGGHALVWGAHYRYARDRVRNSDVFAFLPAQVNQDWSSLFGQGDLALADAVRLTLGARVERNDYTGAELLPSARISWKAAPDQLLWAAASRAVRAPSRLDRDAFVPGTPPFLLRGGPEVTSEIADVYEAGYRGMPHRDVSASITAFHARYDDLHTQQVDPGFTFLTFANGLEARVSGVEAWATWQAARAWRLSGGFTALHERFSLKPGSNDPGAVASAGRDPAHTWTLRSSHDLPHGVELDLFLRGTGGLSNPTVPGYTSLDVRVGWRPSRDVEIAAGARNLGGGHGEFTDVATRAELSRTAYLSLRWYFGSR
jgi:iron complex outermembrane receptor protein